MAHRLKLNEKILRDAEPQEGNSYQIFHTEIRELAAKVQPSGNRVFTLDYRFAGQQGPKVSVNKAFLRAAAVTLWEQFPEQRDQLVSQARTLIGAGTKVKVRKLVENHNNRHDVDIAKSGSALSIHMPLIRDLIEHHGYRTLKDFA